MKTPLEERRLAYVPHTPKSLQKLETITFTGEEPSSAIDHVDELTALFPHTFGQPVVTASEGEVEKRPLRVGVVLSGGQAAGGHNVITGLFDALKTLNGESKLFGFLNGPGGIVDGKSIELETEKVAEFRNMGGFDLIGSGRTKIETDEQLSKSLSVCSELKLDGLVIIGGDDSNTNAAILAEYFKDKGCTTKVIGVPKTIDGDLKNDHVEVSFGFDTACKVYSEMIGNIGRDALSAKKYFHFIKLMGRSASHIALECALATQPNYTLIGEEVARNEKTLAQITKELADMVENRAKEGKNYGIALVPEGLIEFIPEMKQLIEELNDTLAETSPEQAPTKLSAGAKETFDFLPEKIQQQLLLDRDPHGNVRVSQIATESLLIETVSNELEKRGVERFSPLPHFFGYEGRAGLPSNFDATYCYALGQTAALLITARLSGYMACVKKLSEPATEWEIAGIPTTSLMNLEKRKGKEKPVIQKALVDLEGEAFRTFAAKRKEWMEGDCYRFSGPIQFFGDSEITDTVPLSVALLET